MSEKLLFLGKIALFKHLPPPALDSLAGESHVVYFPEGHVIRDVSWRASQNSVAADGLYVIKSGAAKVTKPSENGDIEAVVAILRERDWFGEVELIDGLPPSVNVTAMNPMECYFLPRDVFLVALRENPEIAVSMLPSLGSMVRSTGQWIAQLL